MEGFEEKTPANFTGVISAAIMLPVALIVYHFWNAQMAVSTFLFEGVIVFAAVIRWNLRKYVWYWALLLILSALHLPLISGIRWPLHWVHGVVLLPIFIVDLLAVLGVIRFAEIIFRPTDSTENTSS